MGSIRKGLLGFSSLFLLLCAFQTAYADPIPYQNVGVYNANTYSFTAASTGDVVAYFAGSTAGYDNQLGMLVNGILTSAGFGLDNHSSYVGQSFDLGHVTAGDSLTFVLNIATLNNARIYSNPTMNIAYDGPGAPGDNHIYVTPYTATSPILPGVPTGTFVAFEDLKYPGSDYNYNDETFVFSNVISGAAVPEPGTVMLFSVGLLSLAIYGRRRMNDKI